ncbi:MAG: tryptophan synthase subunit alpha [Gammaproteobacteria bacterium]|nr:tryptophan synthase subunit alpha [Gammaproteobacteria bacterium]HBF10052.1 tryptophan synthase subunit alpha [Gammaproteobacteria bacterium]|tara:strand:- start:21276 stop:22130 length:855 start_codon:yes stop_codon:yes gene_type:complete
MTSVENTVTNEKIENRIDTVMGALKAEGRKALVPYLPIGYPEASESVSLLHAIVDGGADMIELGVPFSDPQADGPVIQQATEIALKKGMNLNKVLDIATEFRKTNQKTPLVMMTYANPIEAMGWDKYLDRAINAGIDAVLLVDVPPEETFEIKQPFNKAGIYLINFVAPTTKPARVSLIAEQAQGFVYYVALKGVTGAATLNHDAVNGHVKEVKETLKTPMLVGFGINDGASAKAVSQEADGVIVGSALVKVISNAVESNDFSTLSEKVKTFVNSLRVALDGDN